jgi:hypothetical protein
MARIIKMVVSEDQRRGMQNQTKIQETWVILGMSMFIL